MTASVIDFRAIMVARDIAVQMARDIAQERVAFLAQAIETWADRAHAGSSSIFTTDPELARAANRWCARKLRAEVRRAIRPYVPAAGLPEVVDIATDAYWGRVHTLHQVARGAAQTGGR